MLWFSAMIGTFRLGDCFAIAILHFWLAGNFNGLFARGRVAYELGA
jgi:hypothetical protein